jgi:S-(hydroxymethyl)glutathione dehydrogenase/alcohol dehydrogenase
MTDFLNTKGMSREDIVAKIVLMTDGGADYTSTPPATPK